VASRGATAATQTSHVSARCRTSVDKDAKRKLPLGALECPVVGGLLWRAFSSNPGPVREDTNPVLCPTCEMPMVLRAVVRPPATFPARVNLLASLRLSARGPPAAGTGEARRAGTGAPRTRWSIACGHGSRRRHGQRHESRIADRATVKLTDRGGLNAGEGHEEVSLWGLPLREPRLRPQRHLLTTVNRALEEIGPVMRPWDYADQLGTDAKRTNDETEQGWRRGRRGRPPASSRRRSGS
jgi:hypothetical protein